MGGSTQQPTQSTTTTLSPQAQQLFGLAYPSLAQFAASPPPARYPGSTVAGFTPTQEAAQAAATSAAGGQQDLADWAKSLLMGTSSQIQWKPPAYTPTSWSPSGIPTSSEIFNDQGIWNPAFNTGLRSAIEAAQRPTWQALTEQALPAIRHASISQGPFGGTREALAEGLATSRANQQALDIGAKMAQDVYGANLAAVNNRYNANIQAIMQKYGVDANTAVAIASQGLTARGQDISQQGQSLDAVFKALGLTPTVQGALTAPAATLGAVGDVQQQMTQAQLNDLINSYYYSQYAPYLQARDILGLLPSIPGATTTSTASVPKPNPLLQSLGGAAIGSTFGPVGAVGGAVLPFLM